MKKQTLCTLAMIVALSLCATAQAQITSVGPPGAIQSSVGGGILDEVSLVTLDVTFDNTNPANNVIQATLTGDLNFTPQEGLRRHGHE